jgi:glycerol-3-phosphate dehydrogenase (NAD(P)+)
MKVAVVGAGAWGTALAISAAQQHQVVLWARNPAHAQALPPSSRPRRSTCWIA